jgi:hypothetical protein
MALLSRRSGVVAMLVGAVGMFGAIQWFNRSERSETPVIASRSSGTHGVAPEMTTPPALPITPPPPTPGAGGAAREADAIAIEVDGASGPVINGAELARRTTNLQAADRRAWRLTELLDNTYIHSDTVIHALTIDGGDYILNDSGRSTNDVIVARRASGELYVGWLDGGADGTRPLADAELPAERIERVARLSLVRPPVAVAEAPAALAVVVDGAARRTVTAASFAKAAAIEIRGQREGSARAIDVARAFGDRLEVVEVVAGGRRVPAVRPAADARAVVYLTRRARFKFAWIDARGEPIDGTKQREVTELQLASRAHLATRR